MQDDFIYFNNLGGARYKRGAAPTNAQLMAMHNAQRHGDPGWGAYANRGGVGVLKFADVIRGQDAQGNETSMVHFSENLLSSPITEGGNAVRSVATIDLTGAREVRIGFESAALSNIQTYMSIPVEELSSAVNAHGNYVCGVSAAYVSFPNKTLTGEAQIRVDTIQYGLRLHYVGKITG